MSEKDVDIEVDKNNSGTVHPAIGVVLMIVFTIIISVVVGTIMLSLGEPTNGAMGLIGLYR